LLGSTKCSELISSGKIVAQTLFLSVKKQNYRTKMDIEIIYKAMTHVREASEESCVLID
jgi:hypothetical protein